MYVVMSDPRNEVSFERPKLGYFLLHYHLSLLKGFRNMMACGVLIPFYNIWPYMTRLYEVIYLQNKFLVFLKHHKKWSWAKRIMSEKLWLWMLLLGSHSALIQIFNENGQTIFWQNQNGKIYQLPMCIELFWI